MNQDFRSLPSDLVVKRSIRISFFISFAAIEKNFHTIIFMLCLIYSQNYRFDDCQSCQLNFCYAEYSESFFDSVQRGSAGFSGMFAIRARLLTRGLESS